MNTNMKKVKTMEINNVKVPRSKKAAKRSKQPTQEEQFKLEVAAELGLLDKVKKVGWDSLSAEESGRLGGIITRRKKEAK